MKAPKDNDVAPRTPGNLRKTYNLCCLAVGLAGILLFASTDYLQPGRYSGFIQGSFFLISDTAGPFGIEFKSRTTPEWKWSTPNNFSYDTLNLNIADIPTTIHFPSLMCEYKNEKSFFSKELLVRLLNPDPESLSEETFQEQLSELLILSYLLATALPQDQDTIPITSMIPRPFLMVLYGISA